MKYELDEKKQHSKMPVTHFLPYLPKERPVIKNGTRDSLQNYSLGIRKDLTSNMVPLSSNS